MKKYIQKIRSFLTQGKPCRIIGWVMVGLFVVFLYAATEMYNFRSLGVFGDFLVKHPFSALFGILLTALLFNVCLLLFRRAWIAATVIGTLYQIFAVIHYYKMALNGDPFVPMDFAMTGSLGKLMDFVTTPLPWWGYVLPLLLGLYIAVLWLWKRELPVGRPILWYRAGGVVVIVILLMLSLHRSTSRAIFSVFKIENMDMALPTNNYQANGFVSAFWLNASTMSVDKPEDYSEETVNNVLKGYSSTDATSRPDVVVVLCESYWDVRQLPGTTFSENPLYFFDELCARDNAYSGDIYTTAVGGGTTRPEFAVLTGLSADYLPLGAPPYLYVKDKVPGHVSLFKQEGYHTVAVHPYQKKFYNRSAGYPLLGFDEFLSEQDVETILETPTRNRGYISDDSFVDVLIQTMEQSEKQNEDLFLFGISMENHQAYSPLPEDQVEITVRNEQLTDELEASLTTYTQGVLHSTRALEKLVNYIDSREKDTVLVFFGDHLPTLGANFAAYTATGYFDGNRLNKEDLDTMFHTPFVIYGNFPLQSDYLDHTRNKISDHYLLSLTAQMSGTARTSYMNWLLDQFDTLPYYNMKLGIEETAAVTEFKKQHHLFTYDRLIGNKYSE